MDNFRFNVSGDQQAHLTATLELAGQLIFKYRRFPGIDFKGYKIDPVLGMILNIYDHDSKGFQSFPFEEGKDAAALAAFFYNYLKSPKAKMLPVPSVEEAKKESVWDDYEYFRKDLSWDEDADHDGDNKLGWRVFTGQWGKIKGTEGICIRPAYCWYGK